MEHETAYRAHRDWLGFVQPVGLVVSPAALVAAQAFVNRNIAPLHVRFLECLAPDCSLADFPRFTREVLGWQAADLAGGPGAEPLPESLAVPLVEYGEVLRPSYAVREPEPAGGDISPWLMLIEQLPPGTDLDAPSDTTDTHRFRASPHARFERLLRETRVPTGLIVNGTSLRLVHAPHGESSGSLTFPVRAMSEPAGRPMFAALHMLLEADRVFGLERKRRLPHILSESRRYQNEVSTALSGQVLRALNELLRGFQAADDRGHGDLLREPLRDEPNHVYGGLLTVLLRLVFVLYAEERGLFPADSVYINNYSVAGLFDRLRADADAHPDTMDRRYGAWAQCLALFRLIHDGGRHGRLHLPPRHGNLFDPDRFPFLEGRPFRSHRSSRASGERIHPPLVPDGVIHRVLGDLLFLDGERISYRTLDVEQIGSVYEAVMGFNLRQATGHSIAVKPQKSGAAPEIVDLDALLAAPPGDRAKLLRERTALKIAGKAAEALRSATSLEAVVAAIGTRVSPTTPNVVPPGAMVLEPSDERRRSGSHYTPRSLTGPIVRTTLEPVLASLGSSPTPEQVLDLRVCDPAMGSGAFLVETCRQIGEVLVKSWHTHGRMPPIPADEDEVLHARRLVAQHCLYGVDKNPLATDLAKLSLWLTTLARDHAFTFVDHALRAGDSLVGLTRGQIEGFHWEAKGQLGTVASLVRERVEQARTLRERIRASVDDPTDEDERALLREADAAIDHVRLAGDLAVAAFFGGEKAKERETARVALAAKVQSWLEIGAGANELRGVAEEMRGGDRPVTPFHWEIEFPEAFGRENPGFDAIVGNPPFLGGTLIGSRLGLGYHDYLVGLYVPATGLADLVAFFLRRCFGLLRSEGTFGLIATNTVAQGDTRATGLEVIVGHGGVIYQAVRRYEWPGEAAVVASLLYVAKWHHGGLQPTLDGRSVTRISSFLLPGNTDGMPVALTENKGVGFLGAKIWGAGFVFEQHPADGSSSLEDLQRLLAEEPRNREVLSAYIGGEEFNASPTQRPNRFVIDFGNRDEQSARQWPALFAIVEERVRPVRAANKQRNYRENWWQHANRVEEAGPFLALNARLLAITSVSKHLSVAFSRNGTTVANTLMVLLLHRDSDFAVIQSRVHESWARFLGSSLKDDLRYTTPCFDTFPRPRDTEDLEAVGRKYYEFRAALMVKNNEGLTKTYNRFHDPDERDPDILKLRAFHDAMDRAVLDAYGWTDITTRCEFLLDYDDEAADEDADDGAAKSKRKKPWRYRWPDDLHDEVLARLLDLNRKRAAAEKLSGAAEAKSEKKAKAKRSPRKASATASKSPKLITDES